MRPLEILLVVVNVLTLVVFVTSRLRATWWAASIVPIAVVVAIVQGLIEGIRWQMVPAYTLTGTLVVVWAIQRLAPADGLVKRLFSSRVVAGGAVMLCTLDLGLSIAFPTVLPVFQFPSPSGPYQIGTVTYRWVDMRRHELFSTDPQAHRELMAQVWYPVKGDTSSVRAPYVQDASALSPALAQALHVPGFTFDYWQEILTHAIPSAPMAGGHPNYPVLIFLTGITGYRQSNTFQVEELVSHGYIVVGIDQPYAAATVVFPSGRQILGWPRDRMQPLIQQSLDPVTPAPMQNGQPLTDGIIPYFAQDVSFTLDQLSALNQADPNGILTGRLNLHAVGVFGISLGAMVASEACLRDARLKACLMMDAAMPADVVHAGLRQPGMWITRPVGSMRLEGWSDADITQTLNTMQTVFNEEPTKDGYFVSISGMFHVNFTDAPYVTPLAQQVGLTGPINAQRGFAIINAYSLAFFDRQLAGRPTTLLDGPTSQYPEVRFSVSGLG